MPDAKRAQGRGAEGPDKVCGPEWKARAHEVDCDSEDTGDDQRIGADASEGSFDGQWFGAVAGKGNGAQHIHQWDEDYVGDGCQGDSLLPVEDYGDGKPEVVVEADTFLHD